jgi:hypothetical protein
MREPRQPYSLAASCRLAAPLPFFLCRAGAAAFPARDGEGNGVSRAGFTPARAAGYPCRPVRANQRAGGPAPRFRARGGVRRQPASHRRLTGAEAASGQPGTKRAARNRRPPRNPTGPPRAAGRSRRTTVGCKEPPDSVPALPGCRRVSARCRRWFRVPSMGPSEAALRWPAARAEPGRPVRRSVSCRSRPPTGRRRSAAARPFLSSSPANTDIRRLAGTKRHPGPHGAGIAVVEVRTRAPPGPS